MAADTANFEYNRSTPLGAAVSSFVNRLKAVAVDEFATLRASIVAKQNVSGDPPVVSYEYLTQQLDAEEGEAAALFAELDSCFLIIQNNAKAAIEQLAARAG
jgi:hypothetical protein